jgi:hypothetical protein
MPLPLGLLSTLKPGDVVSGIGVLLGGGVATFVPGACCALAGVSIVVIISARAPVESRWIVDLVM